ncbi:MAG TPA: bifunctional 2-polyprenyl-6-hydroxyphenol methylase/3-demethylubiquinol 3-O-methyltransferase UbiG [Ktedonobacterales bacterium]
MPADNTLYDQPGDLWWDDQGIFSLLRTSLNPARVKYFHGALERLGVEPAGMWGLDVGCGGGLLAEELARWGCAVTGIDPASRALAVAAEHAAASGLDIHYVAGAGEALPVGSEAYHIVVCCDTLEHVEDPERVVGEIARALAPGGVFLFDTINRTIASGALAIWLLQEFPLTRILPRHLHVWERFIRPDELLAILERNGLELREVVGLTPRITPDALAALWRYKCGRSTAGDLGRRFLYDVSHDVSVSYAGFAVKR